MSDDEKRNASGDVLGIKPLASAIEHTSKKIVDGIGAVLGKICLPAAEELGLALKDRISLWRQKNIANTLEKAKPSIDALPTEAHAPPRLVHEIVDQASWTDDPTLQSMWAGLLTSSCSVDDAGQDNLLFVSLLRQLTPLQAKLLQYSAEKTPKARAKNGAIVAGGELELTLSELQELTGTNDFHRLDVALDHLRSLGLINVDSGGFWEGPQSTPAVAGLTANTIAMHLFARAQGWSGDVFEYYGLA